MVARNSDENVMPEEEHYEPEPEKTKAQREQDALTRKAQIEVGSMKVGAAMNQIFELVDDIDDDELAAFEDYLKTQQTIGPLFNPGFYRDRNGFTYRATAEARVVLLRAIKALREEEMESGYV